MYRIICFLYLLAGAAWFSGIDVSAAVLFQDGFESVACQVDNECDFISKTPICISSSTCQGTAAVGICKNSFCAAEVVENDSGCVGLESADCGFYVSVLCTAETEQQSNQGALCHSSCAIDLDCDPNAHCDGSAYCVANVCGDGVVNDPETCDDNNNLSCGTCSANCNAIQSPSAATGSITTIAGSLMNDGETLVVPDGFNQPAILEFEVDGDGVSPGSIPVVISHFVSATDVKNKIIVAVNAIGASLFVTASDGGPGTVVLTNERNSSLGNQPLIANVAGLDFSVTGMSGGAAGDCPASIPCASPDDCASGSCSNSFCD